MTLVSKANSFYKEGGWHLIRRKIINRLYKIRDRFFYHSSVFVHKNYLPKGLSSEMSDWQAYQYLKRCSKHFLDDLPIYEMKKGIPPRIVWWCWLQGEENAPQLCKACLRSIKENLPQYEIIIITNENYRNYTNIPRYIIEKYEKGIILRAHFADILRTDLLVRNGGVWIDSTVYCTGYHEDLFALPFFVFKNWRPGGDVGCVCSNWLISSTKNNPILKTTLELTYYYWRKHDSAVNYLFYHLLFHIATERYPEQWKQVPNYPNTAPHVLQFELFDEYSEERLRQIKGISDFHKLTRHKVSGVKGKTKYSFYEFISNS